MKLVINTCYGGFGLSHEGVMRYAELKGIALYPYIDDISKQVYGDKATLDNPNIFLHYTTTEGEGELGKSYFSPHDIARDDKALIKVVRELGERADGSYARLAIIKIPDGVEWQIEEYDGIEWVAEKHRTWR